MNDYEIDAYPHYRRAVWMLENQIHTANNMIAFWSVYGPWNYTKI